MVESVGLIGLGLVGTAIAERLLAEGFEVLGFDIDSAKRNQLVKSGGKTAESAAEVGERTQRVILSLPDTSAVAEVVEGAGGILETATAARYIIDTTTGDPDETTNLAKRLANDRIEFLDAPFSGSSEPKPSRVEK